jgi:hypothetical protein
MYRIVLVSLALAVAAPRAANAQAEAGARFDIEAVQGILAVQRLDGWLLK